MAEEEAAHRHAIERELVAIERALTDTGNARASRGQILGFLIALAVLLIGAFVTVEGYPWVGVTVMGLDIVALTALFVLGQWRSQPAQQRPPTEEPPENREVSTESS